MKTQATRLVPFVPSGPNFAGSIDFFCELGFEKIWEHKGVAGLRFGGAQFILQEVTLREWQENQMIVLEVEDLDAYWTELQALDLTDRFAGVKLKPPTVFPWGRELHIIDLAGVCWHVRESA